MTHLLAILLNIISLNSTPYLPSMAMVYEGTVTYSTIYTSQSTAQATLQLRYHMSFPNSGLDPLYSLDFQNPWGSVDAYISLCNKAGIEVFKVDLPQAGEGEVAIQTHGVLIPGFSCSLWSNNTNIASLTIPQ